VRAAIRGVGRTLITAGLLILGFVAYQLWGTGYFHDRAQDEGRRDFERQLEERERTPPPVTTDPTTPTTVAPYLPPPAGEPVGIIKIPKIGVDEVVFEGTTVPVLRKGPGHYDGTPLPGQEGNSAIAGHRTTYGAPFGDLDQLAEGDIIRLETVAGRFDYEVVKDGVFTVKPSQDEVLDPIRDEQGKTLAMLTLTTCNPKFSASERLIVQAKLRGRDALPPPPIRLRPISLDAGLSGERSSRFPTILWGSIAAVIGLLWWLLFHRHRSVPNWFIGFVPFFAALVVFYAYLERLLPSNY
jgi:sortase A